LAARKTIGGIARDIPRAKEICFSRFGIGGISRPPRETGAASGGRHPNDRKPTKTQQLAQFGSPRAALIEREGLAGQEKSLSKDARLKALPLVLAFVAKQYVGFSRAADQ
jgi:hypothetical protein